MSTEDKKLMVATRLHLGQAQDPPTDLTDKLGQFLSFCGRIQGSPIIAVDATPKIPDYDLVQQVRTICSAEDHHQPPIIIPVTPWGKFVPALNAIITHASQVSAQQLLFVSAETTADDIQPLQDALNDDTLVVGAVLAGHDYRPKSCVPLSGTTTPWNTMALWNLSKLALTGFLLVSEMVNVAGVEEAATIASLQHILGASHAKAKLVPLKGTDWKQSFTDPQRRAWHEAKMKSKVERARTQLEALGLTDGVVEHI